MSELKQCSKWPPPTFTQAERLQRVEHHWSQRPQTWHKNWMGQAESRRHCCSCASVALTSFSLCEGGWWSFRALLLILTFEQLSVDIPVWFSAVVSYDVRFNTWRSFNSQGKVVTLIRCGGLLLLVWFCITLTTFLARITTLHLYLPKLYLKHYWSHFFRTRCILVFHRC